MPGTPTPSPVSRDLAGVRLSFGVEEHVGPRRRRCGFAVVDRYVLVAAGQVHHHEAAAADIAGLGQADRQREADRHRGIDRIAAALEHVEADPGRPLLLAHHHAVLRGGHLGSRGAGALLDEALLRQERCRRHGHDGEGGQHAGGQAVGTLSIGLGMV